MSLSDFGCLAVFLIIAVLAIWAASEYDKNR